MLAIHPNARTTPAGGPRRDRPLGRAHRRAGPAPRRQHRNDPEVAQARARRLPGPLQPSPQAALEGERGGTRGRLRPAPRHRLPARRADLRGQPLPAPPEPRRGLPHPESRGPGPPAGPKPLGQAGRPLQGVRPWLRAPGREAPAQAARPQWCRPQALSLRRHRPLLALGSPGREGRRNPSQRGRFPAGGCRAFPFQVTHVLTDRGSCFTADGFEAACRTLGVAHRTTRPYTPRTNGMVERFNGRVQREVLGITIHSHRDLEVLLYGFNEAYNARRQRVLGGVSPHEAVRRRLEADPRLASTRYEPRSDPCIRPKALLVIEAAKEVSHPDN